MKIFNVKVRTLDRYPCTAALDIYCHIYNSIKWAILLAYAIISVLCYHITTNCYATVSYIVLEAATDKSTIRHSLLPKCWAALYNYVVLLYTTMLYFFNILVFYVGI